MVKRKKVKIKLITAREIEKEELKEETLLRLSERLKEAAQDRAYIKKLNNEILFLKEKLRDNYKINEQLKKKTNLFKLNIIDQLEKLKRQNNLFNEKVKNSERLKEALKKLRYVVVKEADEIRLLNEKLREKRKFNEIVEKDIKLFKNGISEELKNLKRKNKMILLMKKELADKDKLILSLSSEIRHLKKRPVKEKVVEVNEIHKNNGLAILNQQIISKLKANLEEKNKTINDLEIKLSLMKQKIEQSKRVSAKKELVSEFTMIRKLKENLEKKNKELTLVEKNMKLIKHTLNEKKQIIENLKKDIIILKEELTCTKKINEDFILKISELRGKEKELKNEIRKNKISSEKKSSFNKIFLNEKGKQYERKIKEVIRKSTLREVQLKTEIKSLKKRIIDLKKKLDEKEMKEKRLIDDFNKKFKEIFLPAEIPDKETLTEHEKEKTMFKKKRTDEIIPMVEIALQHNEPVEKIKESLVNTGYDEEEVESVIRNIK